MYNANLVAYIKGTEIFGKYKISLKKFISLYWLIWLNTLYTLRQNIQEFKQNKTLDSCAGETISKIHCGICTLGNHV